MTVVFDAGHNSAANFTRVTDTELDFVGSIPPSHVPDLLALPAGGRVLVDGERFGGLTADEGRRVVYGAERRVVLTRSPTLHAKQVAGFAQTLAKALAKLDEPPDPPARQNPQNHPRAHQPHQ